MRWMWRSAFGGILKLILVSFASCFGATCIIVWGIAAVFFSTVALGDVYRLSPSDDWFSILSNNRLQPGDEVILSGGVYSTSRKLKMWQQGTAEEPIVIRSADGERAVITRPDERQNVINIEGGQYLVLRGLEITGGSAGIRLGGGISGQPNAGDSSRFVTIEDSVVHGVGDVAISANNSGERYEGMIFRRNEIYDTGGVGEAFYLGCNNNACQFFDGLIEGNYIHDLDGPRVSQGDGIEIKHGSYNNMVRDNVIHDTNFPGILAYGTAGNGGPNIIERNVIWSGDNQGIQVAADAIVRNNIVFSNRAESFRSQNHQGAKPGNLTITHNTFVSDRTSAVRIADPATAPIVIANNAIYARTEFAIRLASTNQITVSGNVGDGRTSPSLSPLAFNGNGDITIDFVDVDWRSPGRDAFAIAGSTLIGAGDPAFVTDVDFNGTPRNGKLDVGAYVYDPSGNPGWQVTSGFKDPVGFPSGSPCDFNGDDACDLGDLDELMYTGLGGDDPTYDLDGSGGTIDLADRDAWLTQAGSENIGEPYVPGDADLSGMVNSFDLNTLGGNWDQTNLSSWADADFNGDGAATASDLNAIGGNWQHGVLAAGAAVPEPSTFHLLMLAVVTLMARSREEN